jgi:predicted DNA-binding transcriptional regulator AlpA
MDSLDPGVTGRRAASIDQFCAEHGISRAFFYKLKKQGKAPRVTALGARRIITNEDAAVWRAIMSAQSAQGP